MMNGVRDRVHQFAADGRSDQRRGVELVVYLASDLDWAIEKLLRDRSKGAQDPVRLRESEFAVIFNPWVSLAIVIIDLIGVQSAQQALEMIQAMPVMSANRGTEHGRKFACVIFVGQGIQKRFTLA